MGRACSSNGGEEECTLGFSGKVRGRRQNYEDLKVGRRIVLKSTLEKRGRVGWAEFIWLSIGTRGGHF
jgi:hypothetical protein